MRHDGAATAGPKWRIHPLACFYPRNPRNPRSMPWSRMALAGDDNAFSPAFRRNFIELTQSRSRVVDRTPQKNMNPTRSKRRWRYAVISLIAAGPAGGFLFGLMHTGDPDPNPIGRLFYACIMAVQTPLHAGFPPRPEAEGGQAFNVWPHIAVSGLLIVTWFLYRDWKLSRQRNAPTA
jgi:hypothetical protein